MKAFRQALTSIFVVLAIIAFVGCGVSKEEHEKAISQINKAKAELEKTVAELSKSKADLAQAMSKVADMEKSLSDAQAQPKIAANEPAADTGTQEKLAAAQKEANELRAKVESLTGENANLQSMLEKVKAQSAEIQKKLEGAQMPTKQLPAGLPKKP